MITVDTFEPYETRFPAIDLASKAVVARTFRGNVYAQQGLFFTPEAKKEIKRRADSIDSAEILRKLYMRRGVSYDDSGR